MKTSQKIILRIGCVLLFCWIAIIVVNAMSKPATTLGVQDGKLAPCPESPNCVCTQADDKGHAIEPLQFTCASDDALKYAKKALLGMPRVAVVEEGPNYLRATATTLLMRYVDDVEIYCDSINQVLHFRSASRLGYSDMGANRKRMEAFRQRFEEISRKQ
ncbi:MAG: DUF1499 domain-containing protein [Planctomycetota bacterium]